MEDKLKEIYYNPNVGLISANKLYQKVKDKGITLKQTVSFIKKQETAQLLKPVIKQKNYFPICSFEPNEHIQIDMMQISNIATTNSYYKYLLVSIDIFTRKAFVVPLKFKSTESVIEGMESIIKFFKPKIITTDNGKEYVNKELKDLLKSYNIEHRFIDVKQHASLGLIDRWCRTLRGLINKFSTSHKTTRYIDVLPKLVDNYNNTVHSTIKVTPNEAEKHIEEINLIMLKKYMKAQADEQVFNIGDKVRHMINLSIFEKQGQSKWAKEINTITDKKDHSYKLDDGKFYRYYQLQPAQETENIKKVGRPAKHTLQTLRKTNTVKRRLKHEDVSSF